VTLELHIDELVLHGFSPADRRGIADAVRAELERRLAGVDAAQLGLAADPGGAPGAPDASPGIAIDRLDAGSLRVADPRPAAVGAQLGGALADALTGGAA
jgi:hypothetical protein